MEDPACYYHRDAAGFCRLENRCWVGKPCPKSQEEADAAREQLVQEVIEQRDAKEAAHGNG